MAAEQNAKFSKAEGYERYLGPRSFALAPQFTEFARTRMSDPRVRFEVGDAMGPFAK